MRKPILILVLAVLVIYSTVLLVTVKGAYPGYTINNYRAITVPTMDGNWSPVDEWADAEEKELDGSLTVYFRIKWKLESGKSFNYVLIDFVNDTTYDAGDKWSICIDAQHDGGSSPQPDDYEIILTGHSISGIEVFRGNGSGWTKITDYDLGADFAIVNSLSSSPHLSTQHWVCEIMLNATYFDLLNNFCVRITAYDASSVASNQCWPGPSYDFVPDDWGETITVFENIPEFPPAIALMTLMAISLQLVYLFRTRRKQK
ncbi:MAG: hypothetical protein QXZ70_09730 [Candidatus Bathyarchaeia archaeon]